MCSRKGEKKEMKATDDGTTSLWSEKIEDGTGLGVDSLIARGFKEVPGVIIAWIAKETVTPTTSPPLFSGTVLGWYTVQPLEGVHGSVRN